MKKESDNEYWTSRWEDGKTGWDIGHISPPLQNYFDQITNRSSKILIPGAGNGYEAEYLHTKGFTDVTVLDISKYPLEEFSIRNPTFPSSRLINSDFFDHNEHYDLILEQTFFSAIHPSLRKSYADKMYDLLNDGGRLVGLLWGIEMNLDSPPFGGNADEYWKLFMEKFKICTLDKCYNSIPEREGMELFINLKRPSAS